ncbi:hypothetical protein [Sinorhizobium meliloti]|uniref:hypothetical protein n=1 Tax=Rhizobium meliloti TaxID=382 RepID=UPI000B4A3CC2|nr:hypothetical protein [Sinorhizobium meliloti]ASQ11086.1 hypothetical protein CDO22_13545 [Sinorhizobium meliloti]MQU85741.1 hypothetical protein [Sinorhizobium meliloti]MQU89277.1 hypothetical protein [Sinorhizobium meliloti]
MNEFQIIVTGLREAGYDYARISKRSGVPMLRILDIMHWGYQATAAELAKLREFNERTKPGALPPRRLRDDRYRKRYG